MNLQISDLARLKTAHDLAVQEYGQDWEGMLTLRMGRQNEAALRKHVVRYFKRHLASSEYKLPLHRSVYIHTHGNDVHAHCYVAHKWKPGRTIGDTEIAAMKKCWLEMGDMRNMSAAKKAAYADLYVHYKSFEHKGSQHGNFGSYGIKEGRDTDYLFEAMDLRYGGMQGHARGREYMKRYGHTTHYQNIVAEG